MTNPGGIVFDYGIGFKSLADRLPGEAEERKSYGQRALKFHIPFLDDLLRGIVPHDLILLGAPTGAGKTELIQKIASANARQGKRVHIFALEAEEREIERRKKYSLLAELSYRAHHSGAAKLDVDALNYRDWYLGRCEHIVGEFNDAADRTLSSQYKSLHTYYRGARFDAGDIGKLFRAIQDQTDLIILDHLHYVDLEGDNENSEYAKLLKLIRSIALELGKPIILVAHLRKRDMRSKSLVPDIEMFHGSSEISKIATIAILLAPAHSIQAENWHTVNTFMHVPKDRMGGSSGFVAVCPFDQRFKSYGQYYRLGRMNPAGDEWTEIPFGDKPRWAENHRSSHSPSKGAF